MAEQRGSSDQNGATLVSNPHPSLLGLCTDLFYMALGPPMGLAILA